MTTKTMGKPEPKFRTAFNFKLKKTEIKGKKMTVPGQALTTTEHIKRAKLGISDKAIKMIYDPEDLYPDIRALDIVDQRAMMKQAREVVQDIRTAGEKYRQDNAAETARRQALQQKSQEEELLKKFKELQTK